MKKHFILLVFMACVFTSGTYAKSPTPNSSSQTSIGMVIYSNDTETVWNALRLANYSKNQGDSVSIFLLGKGVELDSMVKTDNDLKEQADQFLENGGSILGCGTCLRSRKNNEPQVCKFSSLADLYELIRKNKIVLTF
ncbi:MAG: DsrE family protein [Bacteroidota bacterium]|nr:DsrE family protein [Bacteroidota bacterium]